MKVEIADLREGLEPYVFTKVQRSGIVIKREKKGLEPYAFAKVQSCIYNKGEQEKYVRRKNTNGKA